MQATLIIVNFNGGDKVLKCLDHLAAQTLEGCDIVVFDNASSDGSPEQIRARFPGVRLVRSSENLGFARANNTVIGDAITEWVILLNPDAYARPDWLAQLDAARRRYPWADAFGSTQIDATNPARIDGVGDVYHMSGIAYRGGFGQSCAKIPDDGQCFAPCAAAAMYRRDVFLTLGGFDERFFCYGEDVDLGFRLRLQGGTAIQLRDAQVFHEGSGITGRHSDFSIYHGHRNRIWLTYKNLPAWLYWVLFPARLGMDLLLWLRALNQGYAPAYWRALRHGYGGLRSLRADRMRIQAARQIGTLDLAKMMCWNPFALALRKPQLWRITAPGSPRA